MIRFLPAPVRGSIAAFLYGLNILFWPLPIFTAALLRFIIPIAAWKKRCTQFLNQVPVYWTDVNNFITNLTAKIDWDVQGLENLKSDGWYLLMSNHRSWVDILALNYVFNRKIPPLKFFMKKELLWSMGLAGWAAYLVGYPILHRHTKEYLAKHPEQKGRDMEITRKACEKFKHTPTTVANFSEGTRFTTEKHARQASPYQYLLRPKAGGIAFSLYALGEYVHHIIDATLIYPQKKMNVWDYFCGRINKIIVRVKVLPITPELVGDYENNRVFRVHFQSWINEVWKNKDALINEEIASVNPKSS